MEVLVFGSAIIDLICYVKRLPKPGETVHSHKFLTGFGGKGANQCVAASRLGARTCMVAKLGDDSWGTTYMEQLRKEGVNVDFVEKCKNETTGMALINVSATGDNQIVIVTGANDKLGEKDVKEAMEFFNTAQILICQLEVPVNGTLFALKAFKGISILNAAPAPENTTKELLTTASILCINETEAALMVKEKQISTLKEAREALRKLMEMGAKTVIITMGPLGAVYCTKEESSTYVHVPTPIVNNVVDTTGAGDAFLGALAYFMVKFPKLLLHQHIGAANEVASTTVKLPGTQSSYPKASQFDVDIDKRSFNWTVL